EQQRADALALVAETALHHGLDPGASGERDQVVVHVDAAVLTDADHVGQSVLEDGVRVPAGTSQRLACDASRVGMRHDEDGRVLPDVPSAPVVPADALHALRAANLGHGLHIDARTACTEWRGERLNVGWAIYVLHPRAASYSRSASE